MEEYSTASKEDSFEILPHLSEYELFMNTQKYRFFSKYGSNLVQETNPISTSKVWNLSEIEFYDIKYPLASGEESDIILNSCHLDAYGALESLQNPNSQEVALFNNAVGSSTSSMIQMDKVWKFNSMVQAEFDFELNNTGIIEILSDTTLNSINNDNPKKIKQNDSTCDRSNLMQIESSLHNSRRSSEKVMSTETEVPKKNTAVKIYRGRSKSSKRICQAVNKSLELYKWLRRSRIIRRVVEGVKLSFNISANYLGLNFSQMFEIEEKYLKLAIVAEKSHRKAIEDAFSEIFSNGVSLLPVNPEDNSIPLLPVGHAAGVQEAEMQIHLARRKNINSTIISTSSLIYESVPQRWQMTIVICLDDPKLQLKMHNFTLSTPIPNEYVTEVARLTPSNISANMGFAINIDQAISNLVPVLGTDAQEFLTGCSSYITLKSAALCLAGMYKKYIPSVSNER